MSNPYNSAIEIAVSSKIYLTIEAFYTARSLFDREGYISCPEENY